MGIFADMGLKSSDILYDAFISFSSKDNDIALKIVNTIEAEGLKCFISSRDIKTSEEWAEKIVHALDRSRMVLYIHTSNSNKSQQISREIQRAVDNNNLPFITYRLTDERFQGSKAYFIESLNWIDSLVDPFENIDKLVQAVKDVKDGRQLSSLKQNISHFRIWFGHHKKSAVFYTLAFLSMLALAIVWPVHRANVRQEVSASLNSYEDMVHLLVQMDAVNEPDNAFQLLSDIDSISKCYADTRFAGDFIFDVQAYEDRFYRQLDSASSSLTEKIASYYEGYLAAPVDALKKPIVDNIAKLESIDNILGKETDVFVKKIKAELQ